MTRVRGMFRRLENLILNNKPIFGGDITLSHAKLMLLGSEIGGMVGVIDKPHNGKYNQLASINYAIKLLEEYETSLFHGQNISARCQIFGGKKQRRYYLEITKENPKCKRIFYWKD